MHVTVMQFVLDDAPPRGIPRGSDTSRPEGRVTLVWQREWGRRPTSRHVRSVLSKKLSYGCHDSPDEGLCVMEMLALITGQHHTDHPELVCPLIGSFVRRLNDSMESDREMLKPYLFRCWNTDDPRADQPRAEAALGVLVRELAPRVFEWLGLVCTAAELRAVKSLADLEAVQKIVLPICEWKLEKYGGPPGAWTIRCLATRLRNACGNVIKGRAGESWECYQAAVYDAAYCVLCGLCLARELNQSRDAVLTVSQRMLEAILAVPFDAATAPPRRDRKPRPSRITAPWYTSSRLCRTAIRLGQSGCGWCADVYDDIRWRIDIAYVEVRRNVRKFLLVGRGGIAAARPAS